MIAKSSQNNAVAMARGIQKALAYYTTKFNQQIAKFAFVLFAGACLAFPFPDEERRPVNAATAPVSPPLGPAAANRDNSDLNTANSLWYTKSYYYPTTYTTYSHSHYTPYVYTWSHHDVHDDYHHHW